MGTSPRCRTAPGLCLGWMRQGVCHHVVQSGNVLGVTYEFGHVAEVAALTGCPRLRRLGEGKDERFVVHEEGEPPNSRMKRKWQMPSTHASSSLL